MVMRYQLVSTQQTFSGSMTTGIKAVTIYHHWDIVVTTNENGSLIVLRLVSSTLTMYIINLDINQNTVYVA